MPRSTSWHAAARYRDNPTTDFHELVGEMVGIPRSAAKNVNFAKAFGAGVRKFATMIGKSESEARELFDKYDRNLPFVSELARVCTKVTEIGDVVAVLIDPITAYLGVGKVDSFRDSDVRGVLGPLKELAEEMLVAIITVMHFSKKSDVANAMLRISNSMAFVGLPRHAYAVIADPENARKLFVRAKNNDATQRCIYPTRKGALSRREISSRSSEKKHYAKPDMCAID